jgi:energy-coupling factor transporter ATP-binding protein EcfA2
MGLGSPIVLLRYHQFVKPKTSLDETCPYQGLRYFTNEKFFFGRRRVTETLRQKLEETAFLPVIGASGSGKSSVVRAGLISWLNKEGNWQILGPILPSIEPLTELKQAFKPIFEPEQLVRIYQEIDQGVEGLKSVISQLPTTERFLLVVDQFEEVFTLCPEGKEKQRDRFIDLLTQVADIFPSNLTVAITIRADFIENCLKYESLTKLIQEEAVYMPPLTEEYLRDIIVKPAEMQGYSWEEGLVEVILDDIREESECLPLLEFTLTELWQPATEQGHRLTLKQYGDLGRVRGTLNHRAEEIYRAIGEKFGERGQEWVKQICLRLVRTGEGMKDTRQRQPKI